MVYKSYIVYKLVFLLICFGYKLDKTEGSENCWNDENECNIKTELFKNLDFSNGLSMQINCSNTQDHLKKAEENENFQISTKYLLMPRFKGVEAVMLDGCQTPLNSHTYGMEFLPICNNITKASLRHFHTDILRPLRCGETTGEDLQLEYLNIQFNEIASIDGGSFNGTYKQLRDVLIEKNSLKFIYRDAFKLLRSLENLYIINEPVLIIKFPDLFEYTSVANLHLEALKQVTSEMFKHLPETLQNLYVANSPLDREEVIVRNSLVLRNLTMRNCALQKFTLDSDNHSTVERIDLSANAMKSLNFYKENNLKELNLSKNQLKVFPLEWLTNLTNLKTLILKENNIKILSLENLLKSQPSVHLYDLSQNRLQSLHDYNYTISDLSLSQVRLKSDQNPWDCLWLHEFAHYHPEKFRILQYEKFISKINVNGLECVPSEKPYALRVPQKSKNSTNDIANDNSEKYSNVSTYTLVYGSPWEFKRNQRAEALIIVFMLPLGIALLFLLLYMWIYCQKMFHLSYYQGISCMRRPHHHNPSQRFDVVRTLPQHHPNQQTETSCTPLTRLTDASDEGGYEVPINGIISECNCMYTNKIDDEPNCQKTVHITYEQLPIDESPHRIYEEIIEVDPSSLSENSKAVPSYDHLSFK